MIIILLFYDNYYGDIQKRFPYIDKKILYTMDIYGKNDYYLDLWGLENNNLSSSDIFALDTNVSYVHRITPDRFPKAASDGNNYFVIWHTSNGGFFGAVPIIGTRLNSRGEIIDSCGIKLVDLSLRFPDIAYGGGVYFVVWTYGQDYYYDPKIYGRRITLNGEIIDTTPILIFSPPNETTGWFPEVCFGDSSFVVVYEARKYLGGGNEVREIKGARVSLTGAVLSRFRITNNPSIEMKYFPRIAYDGSNYFLVVWKGNYNIYGARVRKDGVVMDPNGFRIVPVPQGYDVQNYPDVAFDGENFFVVWDDLRRNGYKGDIYGARVNRLGQVIDTSGILIDLWDVNSDFGPPRVRFLDGKYYVSYLRYSYYGHGFYYKRVLPSGEVIDSVRRYITFYGDDGYIDDDDPYYHPTFDMGSSDSSILFLCTDDRKCGFTSYDIYERRIDKNGDIIEDEDILISMGGNNQRRQKIAFDGENFMVVYEDNRNMKNKGVDSSGTDIYGMLLTGSGDVLKGSIPICRHKGYQRTPDICFGDSNYLVVWEDKRNFSNYNIYGARVSISGEVLDTEGIKISNFTTDQGPSSVSFDGENFMVVWGGNNNIYGAKVNQGGILIDTTPILIYNLGRFPDVAFDGTNYMVVCEGNAPNDTSPIYGRRVSPSGQLIGPLIKVNARYSARPRISFDGTNYLVIWKDFSLPGSELEIKGTFVTPNGIVIDTSDFLIKHLLDDKTYPCLSFDGSNYLVVWDRYDLNRIEAKKVSKSGEILDSFIITDLPAREPAVCYGSNGKFLITFARWTDSIGSKPVNSYRICGKIFSFPTGIEEIRKPDISVYPNPFTISVNIEFNINIDEIKIMDITGREIRRLIKENGVKKIVWDGKDNTGKEISSGIYFIHIREKDKTIISKIIKIR